MRADVAIHHGAVPLVVACLDHTTKHARAFSPPSLAACCELVSALCSPPTALERQSKLAEGGGIEALVHVLSTKYEATLLDEAARAALMRVVAHQPQIHARAMQAGAEARWLVSSA